MDANCNAQITARNVIDAISIISGHNYTQEQFRHANIIVSTILDNQDFKYMFDIGSHLILNSKQYNATVLDFGLKLIETGIRLHWQRISLNTRDELKTFLESILQSQDSSGKTTLPILSIDDTTPRHILNSISKCFCEVIKCDWPQRWTKLISKLLSTKRNLVVIFILLRLAEDIGIFCEPPNNIRRREITHGLNARMIDIYLYIVDCTSSQNVELMKPSLECLTALLNWTQFNKDLAKYLCQVIKNCNVQSSNVPSISEIEIRRSACEALIVCLERKHSKPDSIDVRTSMFEDQVNLRSLIESLDDIHRSTMQELTQEKLELEKKLCQLLTLILRYVHIGPPEKPQNLQEMYSIMKIILSHPSITVSIQAVQFWNKVFTYAPKKPISTISDELTASLLFTCACKLVKQTYDSHLYGFEIDCQQEFDVFQSKFKSEVCEMCRCLTQQNESICFELVYRSLAKSLQQSNINLNEWDALASLSGAVCPKIKDTSLYALSGVQLIKSLMLSIDQALVQASNIQSNLSGPEASLIPDLISSQLSCISALQIFLPHWHQTDKELTKEILNKITLLAFHRPDKSIASSRQLVGANVNLLNNEAFMRGFRMLSRHASACFVKMCLNNPKHLLNIFNELKLSVDSLFATATDNPYSSEKCQLYEGLTLICNEEPLEVERKKFVLELFKSVEWFKEYELTCDQFIDFVGLNRMEPEQDLSSLAQTLISQQPLPTAQLNRVKLSYVITFLCSLAKRINSRQTLLPELLSFVKPILNIMHTMHTLWIPEMQSKCLKDYQKILFAPVSSSYKQQILDTLLVNQKSSYSSELHNVNESSGDTFGDLTTKSKGDAQYIDLFSWNFYDTLLNCIGAVIMKSSRELFSCINNMHLRSALTGAEYLPPLKLHKLIKNFVMPLVGVCSKDQQLIDHQLLPLLSDLLPFMFNKLEGQWKLYKEAGESSNNQDEDLADEMVSNHLLRNLSRDFIDLMNLILVEKVQNNHLNDSENSIHRSQSNSNIQNGPNINSDQQDLHKISNLGLNLLAARPDFVIIVMTSTLTWSDSNLNSKSISINLHLIKHLLASNLIKTIDEASLLFRNIVTSLGMFGEHEQNCAGLIQLFALLYEGLRMKIENFSDHLAQITSIDPILYSEYETKTMNSNEKVKRSQLRKVLDKLIGKNIGQRYKVTTNNA